MTPIKTSNQQRFVDAMRLKRSPFRWYEAIFPMSTCSLALFSVTYEEVGLIQVPATLFNSSPTLFYLFVILNSLAFAASLTRICLRGMHTKIKEHLSLFAFTTFMAAFPIYLSVLLPGYLKCIPYLLLLIVFIVLLYVRMHKIHTQDTNSNASDSIP